MIDTQELKAIVHRLGEQKSVITEAELLELGADSHSIQELVTSGTLYPSAKGIFMPDNADFGEHHTRVETLVRFPNTILCLLSALSFHRLTTQMPRKVWIAYNLHSTKPVDSQLPVEAITMSTIDFNRGIEIHEIEGIKVKIFGQAKTIADCFHYQHLVGIDVAVEALEQALKEERCQVSEILNFINFSRLASYTQKDLRESLEQIGVVVS